MLDLVLRAAGAEPLGEIAPEAIEARVGHLEDAAHELRAVPVEEQRRLRRVAVARLRRRRRRARESEAPPARRRSRGWRAGAARAPSAARAPVIDVPPSVVKSPSSTAESSTFAGQKAMPTSTGMRPHRHQGRPAIAGRRAARARCGSTASAVFACTHLGLAWTDGRPCADGRRRRPTDGRRSHPWQQRVRRSRRARSAASAPLAS